ncbi:hypothetical protein N9V74_01765 [Alteromonas sp.]|nr:hypothetical protein [Alteromonas sp.]
MCHVAFLSTDNLEAFFVYDELLIPFFNAKGWRVTTVSWHVKNHDWSQYDYVVVRSTWDYQQFPSAFLTVLAQIDAASTTLLNPLSLMQWNIEKFYLQDLAEKGCLTVPTCWQSVFNEDALSEQFDLLKSDKLIVKPVLSANADDTFKVTPENIDTHIKVLSQAFNSRPFMIQPFLLSVVEEGEYSLFYFGGVLSHAILKTPAEGDFRVQEEHGGRLKLVTPTAEQCKVAEMALASMPAPALYARVDLIDLSGSWAIMELELIEPSLYFNLDEGSCQRFVSAMLRYHSSLQATKQ